MERYSVITEKNPREIVLLRGSGCRWKQCTFCDYHLDASPDEADNFRLNRSVLERVTGQFGHLEVINSGSFPELDQKTMELIRQICVEKGITLLHFESHWMYRGRIPQLRAWFAEAGVTLKLKQGVESFDPEFREKVLKKGIRETDPAEIARGFDECCLLVGVAGQTAESMVADIETGLAHFERVCVNVMCENTTAIRPDPAVIALVRQVILPRYGGNDRVDLLMENTEFGVGAKNDAE